MAKASQATVLSAAHSCSFTLGGHRPLGRIQVLNTHPRFRIRASSEDPDCNTEECAPDKEVGKVSMEWLAGDRTKVAGTYPPKKRGWTGYVEKDTAGQTNIYSVEPAVYVAESAISSGTAGTSADGSENTAAVAAGLALIFIAGASFILIQVSKNPPTVQTADYSGPALSYYISKFTPAAEAIPASAPIQTDQKAAEISTSNPEYSQIQVESGVVEQPSATEAPSVS